MHGSCTWGLLARLCPGIPKMVTDRFLRFCVSLLTSLLATSSAWWLGDDVFPRWVKDEMIPVEPVSSVHPDKMVLSHFFLNILDSI